MVPRIGMQLNVLFCSSRSPFPVVFTGLLLGVIADFRAGFLLVTAFLLPLVDSKYHKMGVDVGNYRGNRFEDPFHVVGGVEGLQNL